MGFVQRFRRDRFGRQRVAQAVVLVPRDDVDVEVEHGLPTSRSVVLQQRQAVWLELSADERSDLVDGPHHTGRLVSGDAPEVFGVPTGEDEHVALGSGSVAQESEGVVVLMDHGHARRRLDELAEDARHDHNIARRREGQTGLSPSVREARSTKERCALGERLELST